MDPDLSSDSLRRADANGGAGRMDLELTQRA